MSSAMDLDASLDDIIKKKRPSNQQKKGNKQQQQQQQQQQQKHQSKNQKSTKNSQNKGKQQQQQQQPQKQVGKKSGILGRLGPNGVHQQSKVNMKQPQRLQLTTASLRSKGRNAAFPKAISKLSSTTTTSTTATSTPKASNIVITKQVSGRTAYDGHPQQQQYSGFPAFERYQPPQQQQHLMEQPIRQETSFSIRGMSAPSGISIRGESGPASVLVSNLDREANSDDVRTACSQFGEVIGCEVFYDRTGRSVGEAEVEFATKAAALDCIAKLDNESADGQILRVILRERPASKYHNKPQETRPVMASTISYPASGKMYADQIETSRYGVSTRRY